MSSSTILTSMLIIAICTVLIMPITIIIPSLGVEVGVERAYPQAALQFLLCGVRTAVPYQKVYSRAQKMASHGKMERA